MTFLAKLYKIVSVKQYTPEVRLFRVKAGVNPQPGQFFEMSIPGVGECPLASCSFSNKHIDMLVRNAGSVTGALFKLGKGKQVFIRGPYGKGFPIKELKGKNLIIVAGGTGIAPVTSMIDYVEQNRKQFGRITIYFGFRDQKNTLLKDRIARWKKKFKVCVCLDKHGFVHQVIAKQKPVTENCAALMCGPEVMMNAVTRVLNNLGVENDKIFWSMERRMECGIGSCGRCLIQDVYCCRDGPVFRYDFIKPRLENEGSNEN